MSKWIKEAYVGQKPCPHCEKDTYFECPKCGEATDDVLLVIKCEGIAEITPEGQFMAHMIDDFVQDAEMEYDILSIKCPFCDADLKDVIKE
jgi:uncharacterized protein (UPF0212 family)